MNSEIEAELVHLLKRYKVDMARKSILQFEIAHYSGVKETEMIEVMNYQHSDNDGISLPVGYTSDKTPSIANSYSFRTEKVNKEALRDLSDQLNAVLETWERHEYYLSKLPSQYQNVIRRHYYEDQEWPEVAKALGISTVTAKRLRNRAIRELCTIYGYTKILPDLIGDPVITET